MAGIRIEGSLTGNVAEVTATNELRVTLPTAADSVGSVRMFSEGDAGDVTGVPDLVSPETDEDYRLRVAQETVLDTETFNYTAQNTGKHFFQNTTMAATWTAAGFTTNSGGITTITTGLGLSTYAMFPMLGSTELYNEIEAAFSAQPTSNTVIDFGLFLRAAANPFAPSDGVYFRLNSSGLQGVLNRGGVETATNITFTYTNNRVYQFVISCHEREVKFWIDDVLYLRIPTPLADGQPFQSASLPFSVRHAITGGAAGAALSFALKDYTVTLGGASLSNELTPQGNRIFGSYQGLSGGTMGSLSTYPNSTNPTAAAPSNTALTANLPAGLGGQGAVIAAVAAATDGIWGSFQVPAGSTTVQGRRLVITGVAIHLINLGAAVATTATAIQFSLAYGHTAVSMATAEAAATKAPRRVPLGIASWPIGAAIGAIPSPGPLIVPLADGPIYVNPGEFVALVGKFLAGTATASQVINFTWQPVYGWE
ncbi:MAG: hypothetical protein ACRC14_02740 [Paracoccaceae bacterium]